MIDVEDMLLRSSPRKGPAYNLAAKGNLLSVSRVFASACDLVEQERGWVKIRVKLVVTTMWEFQAKIECSSKDSIMLLLSRVLLPISGIQVAHCCCQKSGCKEGF